MNAGIFRRNIWLGWYTCNGRWNLSAKNSNLNFSLSCSSQNIALTEHKGFFNRLSVSAGLKSIRSHSRLPNSENVDLRDQIREQEDSPDIPSTQPPPPTTTESPVEDMSKYKLPETAAPLSYDLYLYPDLQTGLFKGKVISAVKILQTTAELILNINKLNLTKIVIDQEETSNFEVDVDYERVVIKKKDGGQFLPTTADTTVNLAIDFEGDMRNRIVGLYRSSYTNNQGQTRYIATSKFEPTYARQAYPCFDEPNMKAKYTVHILKPNDPNYIALSNNPQASEEPTADGIMVHFNETVPMSTYLSCFIVSDFVYTETHFQNGAVDTPFRVYASPGQLDKTTYAGRVGKAVIEYYINYFNIPYPLPKLDMVAIPDFVSGAMEHWGLVTFRETALLYTDTTHSSANKQRVAVVVAHELAHSWFGNLVTMNWWNDLWLNEGFASYIEFKGVLAAEPDWGMLDQFLISQLHSVLSLDATQSSHPIIQTVTTPNEITEVFDTISYNKGASVLRMLEDTVGDRHFQTGVTNYLNKHLYGNAITQDLWTEIQGVLDTNNIAINVSEFMGTFTVQMGYPILTAAVSSDGNRYTLRQKRFLTDPDSETSVPSPLGYKWSVPIKYITNLGESGITWFKYNDNEVTIEKPANAQWLKFNPKQIGYYRINYPENDWKTLSSIMKDLSVSDRTHLLEEAFSIAASGELSYATALDMTKYLTEEFDYVPWSVASSVLQRIERYLGNSQYESDFKNYAISLLKPAYARLTWTENPNDSHLTRRTRVVVLDLACSMDYPEALTQAKEKFDQWITNGGSLSQDLRSLIYQYGMVKADEATWYRLFDLFTNETDASEKLKLMNGLTSIRIPSLLTRLIELAKDETYVRGQDYFTLLQYIAGNPIGQPIVWDYVRENWQKLVDRFGLNERYLGRLIPSITSRFSTNLKLEEMGHFFTKYPEAGAGASARLQALETVRNNIKWLDKYRTTVEQWIASNAPQQTK